MSTTTRQDATYGHLLPPAKTKVGPFTLGQFFYAAGVLAVTGVALMFNFFGAFLFLIVSMLPLGVVMAGDALRVNIASNVFQTFRRALSKSRGDDILIQGPLTEKPQVFDLPGCMSKSTIQDFRDELGQEVALIGHPNGQFSVAFVCSPQDISVQDMKEVDLSAAHWGQWLGQLSSLGDCVGAQAVIEAAPDPGHLLAEAQLSQVASDAPSVTKQMLDESLQINSSGASLVTWVTLTFCPKKAQISSEETKMSTEEFINSILTRLPELCQALKATGAGGSVRPAVSQEICKTVRTAFDPDTVSLRPDQHESVDWLSCGPVAMREFKDRFEHDGWMSRSFHMTSPPRGEFNSLALRNLLQPHSAIPRKRVVCLYRPYPAEDSAILADRRVRAISSSAESRSAGTSAAHDAALTAAQQNAIAEASGASFILVSTVITVTASSPEELARASASLIGQTRGRFTLRKSWQSQSAHFLATLPLGIVNRKPKKEWFTS